MSSRLSVIFYIILCVEIGVALTILPWWPHGWAGLSDWGNNYFLILASRKVGYSVQRAVASGWVRGAVSGIGVLNLVMAVWQVIHFRQTVEALDSDRASVESSSQPSIDRAPANDAQPAKTDPLSDYPRRNR
jgi:hypothetical protein